MNAHRLLANFKWAARRLMARAGYCPYDPERHIPSLNEKERCRIDYIMSGDYPESTQQMFLERKHIFVAALARDLTARDKQFVKNFQKYPTAYNLPEDYVDSEKIKGLLPLTPFEEKWFEAVKNGKLPIEEKIVFLRGLFLARYERSLQANDEEAIHRGFAGKEDAIRSGYTETDSLSSNENARRLNGKIIDFKPR